MSLRKFVKYTSYVLMPVTWYYIGTHDKEYVKISMYNKGLNLSQKFKKYPSWDNYVEPFIIKQSSVIFAAGNSFIKGMISDNQTTEQLEESLKIYENEVEAELRKLIINK